MNRSTMLLAATVAGVLAIVFTKVLDGCQKEQTQREADRQALYDETHPYPLPVDTDSTVLIQTDTDSIAWGRLLWIRHRARLAHAHIYPSGNEVRVERDTAWTTDFTRVR